jgi:amidase
MSEAIAAMRSVGAVLVDPAEIPTKGKFDDSEFEVLLYEFKAGLDAYLTRPGSGARVKSLADLIAFNERNREREMPFFGQEIFLMAQKKGPLTTRAYRLALAKNHQLSRAQGIDAVIAKHRLDAIVAPTGSPAWPTDLLNGDHFTGGSSTMAAVAGYPNVTIPVGLVHGLPVGISFFASAFSEPTLIKVAYALEQTLKARTAPRFLQTLDLRS